MAIEFLDHTADIAVRLTAASLPELFREAVRALHLIWIGEEGIAKIARRMEVPLDLEAPDGETLLVDLLNELIYLFDSRKLLLPELEVTACAIIGGRAGLQGTLRGEPFDAGRHLLHTEVKSATFHDLEIRSRPGAVEADVVFDL